MAKTKKPKTEKTSVYKYQGAYTKCTESEYLSALKHYGENYPALYIGTFETEAEADEAISGHISENENTI